MKKFKKLARLMALVFLIVLASIGIGITGAAPISSRNRETFIDNEPKTELVETKEGSTSAVELDIAIQ